MKISVRILAVLTVLALLFCCAACTGGKDGDVQTSIPTLTDAEKIQVALLDGPTRISLLKLANDKKYIYNTTVMNAPDEIAPLIATGEIDIAACPLNLAANLYNKTNGGVRILAINTLGVLSIVENGTSVQSISDLKGKTIHATGKGATPEYILNYILTQNGLDPQKDVTVEYYATHNELATLAIEGKADLCMLPEPFATKVTSLNTDFRAALSLTEEWSKVSDVRLAQGCIIARTEFVELNPGETTEFLENAKASVAYLLSSETIAAGYLYQNGLFSTYDFAMEVFPRCNIVHIEGSEMKRITQANLEVLYGIDPACVGGALPGNDFYYGLQ